MNTQIVKRTYHCNYLSNNMQMDQLKESLSEGYKVVMVNTLKHRESTILEYILEKPEIDKDKIIAELEAKVKELENENKEIDFAYGLLKDQLNMAFKDLKEQPKQIIEKIKDDKYKLYNSSGNPIYSISEIDLDNLLKEFGGDYAENN